MPGKSSILNVVALTFALFPVPVFAQSGPPRSRGPATALSESLFSSFKNPGNQKRDDRYGPHWGGWGFSG